MFVDIYNALVADASVQAALGAEPRVFAFGEVIGGEHVDKPYAVWQTVSGAPLNTLHCTPDKDGQSIQIDVYGEDKNSTRSAAKAIRDALEPTSYMTGGPRESREEDTRLYRVSMDFGFLIEH